MVVMVFFVSTCALAQPAPSMPEQSETLRLYEIRLKGEPEPIYGWVDEEDWGKSSVRVILDEPWLPVPGRTSLIKTKIERYQEEWAGGRDKRRAQQARKAGYEVIGDRYYAKKEIEWAEKARTMAASRRSQHGTTAPDTTKEAETPSPAEAPPAPPGLIQRWGIHAVVAAAAFVLVVLIAKTMLLA